MKHFISPGGKIYAFEEDGSQDHLISSDLSPITEEERVAIVSPTESETLEIERGQMIVSPFQAIQALDEAGYLGAAETAVEGSDVKSQRAWNKAQEFRRNSPTVKSIAASIGITDSELDELFRYAKTIEA